MCDKCQKVDPSVANKYTPATAEDVPPDPQHVEPCGLVGNEPNFGVIAMSPNHPLEAAGLLCETLSQVEQAVLAMMQEGSPFIVTFDYKTGRQFAWKLKPTDDAAKRNLNPALN